MTQSAPDLGGLCQGPNRLLTSLGLMMEGASRRGQLCWQNPFILDKAEWFQQLNASLVRDPLK
eukprot:739665-Pyramimonas_sp.AAC.1